MTTNILEQDNSIERPSDVILIKQQVRKMFIRRLRISASTYYQHFRPKLKLRFLSMVNVVDLRIPHRSFEDC